MTINLYIDKKKYKIKKKNNNLLQICLSLGFNIPYFCWHPAMGSVGSCRQCAIKKYKNYEDKNGQIVMACMTSLTDNTFITINDKESKNFRKFIIELLMTNHPHDCPICEEGGNCHLQDMTVITKHKSRRYNFKKRTYYNQYLGPFISHEMNRCITCYRCVRYYKEYAQGNDFGVFGISNNIYFGRTKEGMLKNEFSGNLIEICPTGVFTDKINSNNYARKWDTQFSPSICQQCSVGCNISIGERYGKLIKVDNRYNNEINNYFLCDKGRFGHGYVNNDKRPKYIFIKKKNKLTKIEKSKALNIIKNMMIKYNKIMGIGSTRASVESNFALKTLVGKKNFSTGMTEKEEKTNKLILKILCNSNINIPSLKNIEKYDVICIFGEDITQTSPCIALAVRQAIKNTMNNLSKKINVEEWHNIARSNIKQNKTNDLFITCINKTKLDDISKWSYYGSTEDQTRLIFAIANKLNKNSPPVINLDIKLIKQSSYIANKLIYAKKPLIISGNQLRSIKMIQAVSNLIKALKIMNSNTGAILLPSDVNSMGVSLIGGIPLNKILKKIKNNNKIILIILENDLYYRLSKKNINNIFKKKDNIILIDHQFTKFTKHAKIILPATTFAESTGTVINYEGRNQRFFKLFEPKFYDSNNIMKESWKWIKKLKNISNKKNNLKTDDIINECYKKTIQLKYIKNAAPSSLFKIHGQKLARAPQRYSGRTALQTNLNIHEKSQPKDKDTMFNFSMEGYYKLNIKNLQTPFIWSPGWNSNQALYKIIKKPLKNKKKPKNYLYFLKTKNINWFNKIPERDTKIKNKLKIYPYYKIWGSEELTKYFTKINKYINKTYIIFNIYDANKLKLNNGDLVELNYHDIYSNLIVKLSTYIKKGYIGLPLGKAALPLSLNHKRININDLRKI
ncbi:NADH-quinone oxidoreductase subunit NuoG [Candidatus Purcelliella pentastirinorum]|uniref:NADH-quinone oxidoreductase n=1 Tax=Candidatus Purcelliella pentastirinorum TaxID=472834 RepID=A0AAX3N8M8_9ENTR|nr:NADH-quinone oxidoreductase subunit NuoG [Candidatus Purcelliella pentastirinorum]WDI78359.1 NADH-quinone oxidoreductase subunit NuoG [Candidatus Purcelliella pentastirinorum]